MDQTQLEQINQRLFVLENKLQHQERMLEQFASSVEDRALAVIEKLCGSVSTIIQRGRQQRIQAADYRLEPVSAVRPENAMTFQLRQTDHGVEVLSRDEIGQYSVTATLDWLHLLAAQYLVKHQVPMGQSVLVNLYKLTPTATEETPHAEQ